MTKAVLVVEVDMADDALFAPQLNGIVAVIRDAYAEAMPDQRVFVTAGIDKTAERWAKVVHAAGATDVLAAPMDPDDNDAHAATVGDYLTALLRTLWVEEDGFSGKRPFGNSGWQYDVFKPLIDAGLVPGVIDPDGYIEEVDEDAANTLILAAIEAL